MLLAHMCDCLGRINEYPNAEHSRFDTSRLVQDARIRNLQTLTESSQHLSSEIKGTEPHIPWRELAGFRNVIVHGYLGVDLDAVWLGVRNDLPALTEAVNRTAFLPPTLLAQHIHQLPASPVSIHIEIGIDGQHLAHFRACRRFSPGRIGQVERQVLKALADAEHFCQSVAVWLVDGNAAQHGPRPHV